MVILTKVNGRMTLLMGQVFSISKMETVMRVLLLTVNLRAKAKCSLLELELTQVALVGAICKVWEGLIT
jgi:hypothetical protein